MINKEEIKEKINSILVYYNEIKNSFKALKKLYPVTIADKNTLYVFDIIEGRYEFVMKQDIPFEILKGVRAAFDLDFYDNKSSCVVTSEIFEEEDWFATILHEFVHCYQYSTCESDIKKDLSVYKKCFIEEKNNMWEINYDFPYDDSGFIHLYKDYINSLKDKNLDRVKESRLMLKEHLKLEDYEYLVWQEWKEGYAKFIENRIQEKYKLPLNIFPLTSFSRESFYETGSLYIELLLEKQPDLSGNIKALFLNIN